MLLKSGVCDSIKKLYIKNKTMKNWVIGIFIIIIAAFGVMWLASRPSASSLPGNDGEVTDFEITDIDHVKGAIDAKVTIVEWSDFQCPACKVYYPVLNTLIKDFPEDVRVVYRHFPLQQIHANANYSSFVTEAASLQGKFWEMHNLLFENQDEWANTRDTAYFEKYAEMLGLDMDKFRTDVGSDVVKNRVLDNYKQALKLGLNSTPTLFVNGKHITNPNTYQELVDLVNNEINPETFPPTSSTTEATQ
jgi:protein-disulfide isomerase